MTSITRLVVFAVWMAGPLADAQSELPQPVKVAPGLSSLHGMDASSGIEYLRLSVEANPAEKTVDGERTRQTTPTFVVECTQLKGKRALSFYLNPAGADANSFSPPFKPTSDNPFPPRNPSISLTMTFEGYVHSKQFKRSWEQLPNGSLKYRRPGLDSSNLEDPRLFLQYLNSLPTLHIVNPKPVPDMPADALFNASLLLSEIARSQICQP